MDALKYLDELSKALDFASGSGVLTQPKVDKVIADLLDHNNPIRQNLPRKPGEGEAYLWNEKSAQSSGGGFVNDTEEPQYAGFTKARKTSSYKTIMERGKVTQFMIDTGRSYRNLLSDEIEDVTLLVKDTEENALVNGDASTNPKEYSGLRKLISGVSGQEISMGTDGAVLTLKKLDETFDAILGRANMLICSKRTSRKLNSLLQSQQRFINVMEVKGGFKVPSYNDAPIYKSIYISDTQTQGASGAVCSDLFVVDNTYVWVDVLSDVRFVQLAKVSSQFDHFDIREELTLVVKNAKRGLARLYGIKDS